MFARNNRCPHAPVRTPRRCPQSLCAEERAQIQPRRAAGHYAKIQDRARVAPQPAPPRRRTSSKRRSHQAVQKERRKARASDNGRARPERSEGCSQTRRGKQEGGESLQGEVGLREGFGGKPCL